MRVSARPFSRLQSTHKPSPSGEGISLKAPGLAEAMELRDSGMHTTDSVDYGVVISGEITLELDDGAKASLKQGDCVVQNGTRHAWRNSSTTPCVMAFVLVGAAK